MPKPLSLQAFNNIQAQALLHILRGGGIVPDEDGSSEIEDLITTVAGDHFGADAAMGEFDQAVANLDQQTSEGIRLAMWHLVAINDYAAFTFGAAVAMQLRRLSPPRRGSRRARKGGRS